MSQDEQPEGQAVKKISTLNEIFEDLITDASDLVKDLRWSVKTYLLFGLVLICFAISEVAYSAEVMQDRYYIPLFIAGVCAILMLVLFWFPTPITNLANAAAALLVP